MIRIGIRFHSILIIPILQFSNSELNLVIFGMVPKSPFGSEIDQIDAKNKGKTKPQSPKSPFGTMPKITKSSPELENCQNWRILQF